MFSPGGIVANAASLCLCTVQGGGSPALTSSPHALQMRFSVPVSYSKAPAEPQSVQVIFCPTGYKINKTKPLKAKDGETGSLGEHCRYIKNHNSCASNGCRSQVSSDMFFFPLIIMGLLSQVHKKIKTCISDFEVASSCLGASRVYVFVNTFLVGENFSIIYIRAAVGFSSNTW